MEKLRLLITQLIYKEEISQVQNQNENPNDYKNTKKVFVKLFGFYTFYSLFQLYLPYKANHFTMLYKINTNQIILANALRF